MRQCPTLTGDDRPLIAHSIQPSACQDRQRQFYHKCHRCIYRGQSADFVLPAQVEVTPPQLNGQAKVPAPAPVDPVDPVASTVKS